MTSAGLYPAVFTRAKGRRTSSWVKVLHGQGSNKVGGATSAQKRVWLIHGTWASRARWTDGSAPIAGALNEQFGEQLALHQFQWTGRNQRFDRELAADHLRAAARADSEVGERRFAIAHSHAGNVIVDALRLDRELFHGVVTLNTPFFTEVPRNSSVVAIHWILLILSVPTLVGHFLQMGVLLEMAISLAIAVLLGLLWLWIVLPVTRRPADYGLNVNPGGPVSTPMLVITSTDDEAFAWLDAMDALINLPYLLLHKVALALSFAVVVAAHWFFRWDFANWIIQVQLLVSRAKSKGMTFWESMTWWYLSPPPQATPRQMKQVSDVLWQQPDFLLVAVSSLEYWALFWALLAVAALLVSFLVRGLVFGSGFGRRAILASVLTRHKVTLIPFGFTNVEFDVFDARAGWLLHSAHHSDYEIAETISRWLAHLGAKPARTVGRKKG